VRWDCQWSCLSRGTPVTLPRDLILDLKGSDGFVERRRRLPRDHDRGVSGGDDARSERRVRIAWCKEPSFDEIVIRTGDDEGEVMTGCETTQPEGGGRGGGE
jgi:hypothetical protein